MKFDLGFAHHWPKGFVLEQGKVNVKSTIPHEECWLGAHLPCLCFEPICG